MLRRRERMEIAKYKRTIIWLGYLRTHFLYIKEEDVQIPSNVYSDNQLAVYIGDFRAAIHAETLQKLDITHIVNCAVEIPCFWEVNAIETLLQIATLSNLQFLFGYNDPEQVQAHVRKIRERADSVQYRARYLHLPMIDRTSQDLSEHIPEMISWIAKEQKNSTSKRLNILFHCQAGVSRSTSLACAFLMNHLQKNYQDCFSIIKSKHRRANPNPSFKKQLENLHSTNAEPTNAVEHE